MEDTAKESQYSLLRHNGDDDSSSIDETGIKRYPRNEWRSRLPSLAIAMLIVMLALSMSCNLVLSSKLRGENRASNNVTVVYPPLPTCQCEAEKPGFQQLPHVDHPPPAVQPAPAETPSSGASPYLKLEYDTPATLWWNTEFSGDNEIEVDYLWNKTMPWESGIIALTFDEAREMGLPESQPWPWDAKNKGIYIVNAHHILHCVRNLYISIHEYRHNKTQTVEYSHILHCLDSIRSETMCAADDTLRYIPLNSVRGFRPGDGQTRVCRDWNKVTEFVKNHDPCYRYVNPGDQTISNLHRFKYCPKDSKYLPIIREFFGYTKWWYPDYDEDVIHQEEKPSKHRPPGQEGAKPDTKEGDKDKGVERPPPAPGSARVER